MSSEFVGAVKPFETTPKVADTSTIRKFVKDLYELDEKVRDAKEAVKEAISTNDEVADIDEQIKRLREERKEVISKSAVIQAYTDELEDVLQEKQQLISDAKSDGIPRDQIDLAIKALKKDIDIVASVEIYKNIADLVD